MNECTLLNNVMNGIWIAILFYWPHMFPTYEWRDPTTSYVLANLVEIQVFPKIFYSMLWPPKFPLTLVTTFYTLMYVMSPSIMSLLLLYPKTLGNGCAQFKFPPWCHISLLYIKDSNIKLIFQRIKTTFLHPPRWRHCHCHYCNVDFVLFHNATCYTYYHYYYHTSMLTL